MKLLILISLTLFSIPSFAQETEQEREFRAIQILIDSVHEIHAAYPECKVASDCITLEIGAKACGGPRDYLFTSLRNPNFSEIGFLAFRTVVREEEYNRRYDIQSDCMSPAKPTSFSCEKSLCNPRYGRP